MSSVGSSAPQPVAMGAMWTCGEGTESGVWTPRDVRCVCMGENGFGSSARLTIHTLVCIGGGPFPVLVGLGEAIIIYMN